LLLLYHGSFDNHYKLSILLTIRLVSVELLHWAKLRRVRSLATPEEAGNRLTWAKATEAVRQVNTKWTHRGNLQCQAKWDGMRRGHPVPDILAAHWVQAPQGMERHPVCRWVTEAVVATGAQPGAQLAEPAVMVLFMGLYLLPLD